MLKIDVTTLADIHIEKLFALVNHSVTGAGSAALRYHITHPPSDCDTIRRIQEAVRFTATAYAPLSRYLRCWAGVAQYVALTWITVAPSAPCSVLQALWLRHRHPQLWRDVRQGLSDVVGLLADLRELVEILKVSGATHLHALSVKMLAAMRKIPAVPQTPSMRLVLTVDHALRGGSVGWFADLQEIIAELDCLWALGHATRQYDFHFPCLVQGPGCSVAATGLYHPLVPVRYANPVALTGGTRLLLITGPNMAGKSTYCRALATAILMAQCGMGVPATTMTLAPVEYMMTVFPTHDDLLAGHSHFMRELMRIHCAVEAAASGRPAMIICDEPVTSTHPDDCQDICTIVLRAVSGITTSCCVFSSHYHSVVQRLAGLSMVSCAHFTGHYVEGVAKFDYTLRPGPTTSSLGMTIFRHSALYGRLEQIASGAVE